MFQLSQAAVGLHPQSRLKPSEPTEEDDYSATLALVTVHSHPNLQNNTGVIFQDKTAIIHIRGGSKTRVTLSD